MEKTFQASFVLKLHLRIYGNMVNCYEVQLYDGSIHSKCIVVDKNEGDFMFYDVDYNSFFEANISEIKCVNDAGDIRFSSVWHDNFLMQTRNKQYMVANTIYCINSIPVLFVDHHKNVHVFRESQQVYFTDNQLGFYYDTSSNMLYFVKFSFNPNNNGWYYYKLHNNGKVMLCNDDHDLCNFMKRNYVINRMANKINIINI